MCVWELEKKISRHPNQLEKNWGGKKKKSRFYI